MSFSPNHIPVTSTPDLEINIFPTQTAETSEDLTQFDETSSDSFGEGAYPITPKQSEAEGQPFGHSELTTGDIVGNKSFIPVVESGLPLLPGHKPSSLITTLHALQSEQSFLEKEFPAEVVENTLAKVQNVMGHRITRSMPGQLALESPAAILEVDAQGRSRKEPLVIDLPGSAAHHVEMSVGRATISRSAYEDEASVPMSAADFAALEMDSDKQADPEQKFIEDNKADSQLALDSLRKELDKSLYEPGLSVDEFEVVVHAVEYKLADATDTSTRKELSELNAALEDEVAVLESEGLLTKLSERDHLAASGTI